MPLRGRHLDFTDMDAQLRTSVAGAVTVTAAAERLDLGVQTVRNRVAKKKIAFRRAVRVQRPRRPSAAPHRLATTSHEHAAGARVVSSLAALVPLRSLGHFQNDP